MSTEQIIVVGLVLMAGSALQSAVGFGFGLMAIPLMIWAGVPLPMAVTVLAIATVAQMGWSCWQYRVDLAWRPAIPMVVVRLVSLPAGVYLLSLLAEADEGLIRQVVGAMLLGVLALQFGLRVDPRPRVHPGWLVLAGSSSGVLGGLIGMGGPPVILWLMAHDWPARQTRSFLWLTVLAVMPLNLLLLWHHFGQPVVEASVVGLAYTPLVLAGTMAGLWGGDLLSKPRLRAATLALLVVIAVSSIVTPWVL
ncbi:MAG: sulfite exporter TauE/SafE family protein [Phycisphaeraceae bacterium]